MEEIAGVADLRAYLRGAADGAEDVALEGLIQVARRAVENRTDRTIVGAEPTIGDADLPVARQATLMLAAHWFLNRVPVSAQTISAMPLSVEWLIAPLARLGV